MISYRFSMCLNIEETYHGDGYIKYCKAVSVLCAKNVAYLVAVPVNGG